MGKEARAPRQNERPVQIPWAGVNMEWTRAHESFTCGAQRERQGGACVVRLQRAMGLKRAGPCQGVWYLS